MSEQNSIRLSNFIPLSNIKFEFTEDEDTGVKHLFLKGIAHGFKPNLKFIQIRKTATRKATRRFNAQQKAGRIHQVWIDHAYTNPYANSTPTEKVIGHVDEYKFSDDEGAKFKMDINPDHPSQIHKAILRRDIDGVSIGADVKREDLYCSVDGNNMFSDDCEHYMGQQLDNGKFVLMEVDDYTLDELTITAKQADLEGKVNLSQMSEIVDATITFSLDAYDKEGKIIKSGLKLQKDVQGESLKNTEKYDKDEKNMPEQDNVDNDHENVKSDVTLDKFNQLVDAVTTIKQSVDANNSALTDYLQAQKKKDDDILISQKTEIVNRIIAKNKDFGKEELLVLELSYLEKLEKAITPASTEDKSVTNTSFGTALAGREDDVTKSKFQLSREDKKAWARLRMGYKTPQAPKHIQARVRARLNGETYAGEDSFIAYLMDKNSK